VLDALHRAFHQPGTPAFRWVDGIVWVLIAISIALFAVDLAWPDAPYPRVIAWVDLVILAAFGVELTLRVLTWRPPDVGFYERSLPAEIWAQIRGRIAFLLQPLNLVDLLVVISAVPALRGLRALRLLRLVRAVRLFRYANPITDTIAAFRANRLLYQAAFTFLGAVTTVGGLSLYLVERNHNPGVQTIADGLWWALVTLTTVGFGDISPQTALGRIVGAVLMVAGMFTLALFAGIVGNNLLSAILRIRQEQFRMSNTVGHVIVLGFDAGSRRLLDALIQEYGDNAKLVVMAEEARPADLAHGIEWVQGDPKKESEMEKVRLGHAGGAVVVGRRSVSPQQADAETLLTLFTIRGYLHRHPVSRRQPLYVVAEILEAENVEHARAAGADEVIETTRLGFSLLAHAVAVPGTSVVMSRVASAGAQNLYVGQCPAEYRPDCTFGEVFHGMRSRGDMLILGLRDPKTGEDHLNPPDHVPVGGRQIVYLAEKPLLAQTPREGRPAPSAPASAEEPAEDDQDERAAGA
jgi:voltage-gated potassium channel